jgi:hypothetical protein
MRPIESLQRRVMAHHEILPQRKFGRCQGMADIGQASPPFNLAEATGEERSQRRNLTAAGTVDGVRPAKTSASQSGTASGHNPPTHAMEMAMMRLRPASMAPSGESGLVQ